MDNLSGWQAIDIFLFSNGQEDSPPRKYHLTAEELELWDATLSYLASSQYGTSQQNSSVNIYTMDGQRVSNPMQLKNGRSYVAVSQHDDFIPAGYQKYMIKATRSWEKRQAKKNSDMDHYTFQSDKHKDYGDVEISSRREVIINIQNLYNRNEDDFNPLNSTENISEIYLSKNSVDVHPTAEETNTWQEDVKIYKTTKGNNDLLNLNKLKRNKVGLISHIKKKENKDAPKGNVNLKHKLNNALQSMPIKKFKVAAASKSQTKRKDTSPLKLKLINKTKLSGPSKNETSGKVLNVNDKKSKSSIASDKGAKKRISITKEIKSVLDENNVLKGSRRKYLGPEKHEHNVRRNTSPNMKFHKINISSPNKNYIDKNDSKIQPPKMKDNEKSFTPAYLSKDKNEPNALDNDINELDILKNVAGIKKETKSEIHEMFSKADNDFRNKSNTGIILNESDNVNLPLELKSNASGMKNNQINNGNLPVEHSPVPDNHNNIIVANEDIVRILYPKTNSTNTMVQTPDTNEQNYTVCVPYEYVKDSGYSTMQSFKPTLDLNQSSGGKITEDVKVTTIGETPFSVHSSNHKVNVAPRSTNLSSNETNKCFTGETSNSTHQTVNKGDKTFVGEVPVSSHLSGDKVSRAKRANMKNGNPLGGKIRQYNFQDSEDHKDGVNTAKRQSLAKRTSFGNNTMQPSKPFSDLNQLSDGKTTEDNKITIIDETPFAEHLSSHKVGEAPRSTNLSSNETNERFTGETSTSSHLTASKDAKIFVDEVPVSNHLSDDKVSRAKRASIKNGNPFDGKIRQYNFEDSENHKDSVNVAKRQSLSKRTSFGNSTMQSLKPFSDLTQLSDDKTNDDIKITTIDEKPFSENLSGHKIGEAPRSSNLSSDKINESFGKHFTDEAPTSSHLTVDKGTKTFVDEVPVSNNLSGDKVSEAMRASIKNDNDKDNGKIHQYDCQDSGNYEDDVNKAKIQSLAKGTSLNLHHDDINYDGVPRTITNKNDVSVLKDDLDQKYKIRKLSQSKQTDAEVPFVKSNKSQVTAIVGRGDIFNLKLNLKDSNVEGIITIDKENANEPPDFILLDKASQTNLNIIFKDKLLNDIELKPNIQHSSNVVHPELHDETKQIPNIIVFQCTCCGSIDIEKLRKIIPKALPHYSGDLSNKYVVIVPDVDYQNQCQNTQKETSVGPFGETKNDKSDAQQLLDSEGQCYCPPDTQDDFCCLNKEDNHSGIVYNNNQCIQTEPSEPIRMSVATSNLENNKIFVDTSTQTSWENTLLIPVIHEDGHCTFRLPPLELIKKL